MNWLFGRQPTRHPSRSSTPESVLTRQPSDLSPSPHQIRQEISRLRVYFGISRATAVGRPSSGGVLTLSVTAVDLNYLSVSRLEPTPVPETEDLAADEDAWCAKLRQLAPKWWRSLEDCDQALEDGAVERPITHVEKERVFVGWPSQGGGVWVLKCQRRNPSNGFGVYEMCFNMDERCEVLKKFGACFYPDPCQCLELTEEYEKRFRRERDELDRELGEE